MVIALTGFMGSGKTTVGRIIADALGCPFVDLDEAVATEAGASVPAIFAAEGEAGFRARELAALRKTLSRYGSGTAVLALGGGTVLLRQARELLREKTLCLWLDASFDTLAERIGPQGNRPLATSEEALRTLLEERLPLYGETAAVRIGTDGLTPDEVADEIIISVL